MQYEPNENNESPEWFEEWFDSPYYHLLYEHRDQQEASDFVDQLTGRLHLPTDAKVCDLACGKGRHSRHLRSKGFYVSGIDLSEHNIAYCKQFEDDHLEFYVHDMRRLFRNYYFDAVLNLFTSFGYFETDHENELAVSAASKSLVRGGYFVIDFLNVHKALKELKPQGTLVRNNVTFNFNKTVIDQYLIKDIEVIDGDKKMQFQEKVRLLMPDDFQRYFLNCGLAMTELYGDYKLNAFHADSSPRLIMITRKL